MLLKFVFVLLKIKTTWHAKRLKDRSTICHTAYSLYGRIKGRLGTMSKFQKPTFNVVLPFSSILAAAEIHGVTFRGWEIRARFPVPLSSPSAPPEPLFHLPCPIIGGAFIAFSCRRVLRSSLIFMQRLHDRTRISPGKRFPSSLFPPTRRCFVLIRRQLSCSNSVEI